MNLWTKAVIILIVFNRFEYSSAVPKDDCDLVGYGKMVTALGCALSRNEMPREYLEHASGALKELLKSIPHEVMDLIPKMFPRGRDSDADKHHICCYDYYVHCIYDNVVIKECNPNSDWKLNETKEYEKLTKDCKPSKDLCDKYHNNVDKTCDEYKYSECEDYNWNPNLSHSPKEAPTPPEKDKPTTSGTFSSLSALNGLVLLSVFPFILIIA